MRQQDGAANPLTADRAFFGDWLDHAGRESKGGAYLRQLFMWQ
jgi:hypothetical protein